MKAQRPRSIPVAVGQFALTGLAAVLLLGVIGVQVLGSIGTSEAIRDAKRVTRLAGEGIVAPALSPALLTGSRSAIMRLDALVRARVLRDPTVRVKIWNERGQIVFSDEHRLIGARYPLAPAELAALRRGTSDADVSDLSQAENRFERGQSKLLQVYQGIRTPQGQRLLFEEYLRFSSVSASGQRLWGAFAPALIGGLLLLELAQIPLALSLARRLRRGQQEREGLLRRAIEASDVERQRIARDLHDGVVQNLAGVSYSLAAVQGSTGDQPEVAATIEQAAHETRRSIRELRSLLVELYPPDLHRAGLPAALADLLAALPDGIATELSSDVDLHLEPDLEALLFRVAQEALRNVSSHAQATRVEVAVRRMDGAVALTVVDDGRGFDTGAQPSSHDAPDSGHFGLRILRELASAAEGRLTVRSAPGQGTQLELELPVR